MATAALLPSEIARLVLGYLESELCGKAYDRFLYECKHLEECRGRDFFTTIMGLSLIDILNDYCAIHSYVLRFKCKDEIKKKLSRCFCLFDKIVLILQDANDNISRLDRGTDPSTVEKKDAQVQTDILSRSNSLDSVRTVQSHKCHTHSTFEASSKKHDCFVEHVNRSIESTSLTDLPGHKADFETVDTKLKNSLSKSSDPIYPIETDNNEIDFPYSLGLIRNTVSPDRFKKSTPSKRKNKNGRPLSPKKYMTITNAILDCTELHEAIANNINQVINMSANKSDLVELDTTKLDKEESLNLKDSSKNGDETFVDIGKQLEGTIKMIVDKTEKDPIFEQLVEELLANEYDSDIVSRTDTSATEKSCPSEKKFPSPTSLHSPEGSVQLSEEDTIKNRLRIKRLPRNSYFKRKAEIKKTNHILKCVKIKKTICKKKSYQRKLNYKKNINETMSKKTIREDYVDNVETISDCFKDVDLKNGTVKLTSFECNSNDKLKSLKHDDTSTSLECNSNDVLKFIKHDDEFATLECNSNDKLNPIKHDDALVTLECNSNDRSKSIKCDNASVSFVVTKNEEERHHSSSNMTKNKMFTYKLCDECHNIDESNCNNLLADKSHLSTVNSKTVPSKLNQKVIILSNERVQTNILSNNGSFIFDSKQKIHQGNIKSDSNFINHSTSHLKKNQHTRNDRNEMNFKNHNDNLPNSSSNVHENFVKSENNILSEYMPVISYFDNNAALNRSESYFYAIPGTSETSVSSVEFGNKVSSSIKQNTKQKIISGKPPELLICNKIITTDEKTRANEISYTESEIMKMPTVVVVKPMELQTGVSTMCSQNHNILTPDMSNQTLYISNNNSNLSNIKSLPPKKSFFLSKENTEQDDQTHNVNNTNKVLPSVSGGDTEEYVEIKLIESNDIQVLTQENINIIETDTNIINTGFEFFNQNGEIYSYVENEIVVKTDVSNEPVVNINSLICEEKKEPFSKGLNNLKYESCNTISPNSFIKTLKLDMVELENIAEETPNKIISKKTCLSTPTKKNSHVRVLDFGTPEHHISERKAVTASKILDKSDFSGKLNRTYKSKSRLFSPIVEENKSQGLQISEDNENEICNVDGIEDTQIIDHKINDLLMNKGDVSKNNVNKEIVQNQWDFNLRSIFVTSEDVAERDKEEFIDQKSISPKKKHVKNKKIKEKSHKLKDDVKSKKKHDSVLLKSVDVLKENAIKLGVPKNRKTSKHKSTFKVKIRSTAYSENLIKKGIDDSVQKKDVCKENKSKNYFKPVTNCLENKSVTDVKEKDLTDKNQEKEIHITPELPKEYRSQPIDVKCNLSALLETPFKRNLLDISLATPKFLSPFENNDPMSLIKCLGIPTPKFDDTPSPKYSGSRNTPGSHSSKQTGYSSGGSYYKPDEVEFDEKEIPKHIVKKVPPKNISKVSKNGSLATNVTNTSSMVLRPRKSNKNKLIERKYLETGYKKITSESDNIAIIDQKCISEKGNFKSNTKKASKNVPTNINSFDKKTESLVKTPEFDKKLNSSTPVKIIDKLCSDNIHNERIDNENIISVSNGTKLNSESLEEKRKRIAISLSTVKENFSVKQGALKKFNILGRNFGNKFQLKKNRISYKGVKLIEKSTKSKPSISTCVAALKNKESIKNESKHLNVNIEAIAKSRRKSSTPRKFEKVLSCDTLQLDVESKLEDFYSTPMDQNNVNESSNNVMINEKLNQNQRLLSSKNVESLHLNQKSNSKIDSNNDNQKSKQLCNVLEKKETIDIVDSSSDSSLQPVNAEISNPIEVLESSIDSPSCSNIVSKTEKHINLKSINPKVSSDASHSDAITESNNKVRILSTYEIASVSKNNLTSSTEENVTNEDKSSFDEKELNLENVSSTLNKYGENSFDRCIKYRTDDCIDEFENTSLQIVNTEKSDQTEKENISEPVIEGEDDDVIIWSNFECDNHCSNHYNYVFDVNSKIDSHKYSQLKDNLDNFALNLNIYDTALNADQIKTIKSSQYYDLFQIEINTKPKKKNYNNEYKRKNKALVNKSKESDSKKSKGCNSLKALIDETSDSSNEYQLTNNYELKNSANIENDYSDSETCIAVKNLLNNFKSYDNTKTDASENSGKHFDKKVQSSIVDNQHFDDESCEIACTDLMTYAVIGHKETYVDKRKNSNSELEENSAKKLKPEIAQHILQQIDIEAVLSSLHGPV